MTCYISLSRSASNTQERTENQMLKKRIVRTTRASNKSKRGKSTQQTSLQVSNLNCVVTSPSHVPCVSALPIITKIPRTKSLLVLQFSHYISKRDAENYLLEQLKLTSVTYSRLKAKFKSYVSFHVSVNEDDFPLTNSTCISSNGCLTALYFR